MSDLALFDKHLRTWAYAACDEWDYPPPTVEWFEFVHARLPDVTVEETFAGVYETSRHLDRIGVGGIHYDSDDTDDDALRKAKMIAALRPLYRTMVGIGGRLDFSVAVHDKHHFDLIPDLVPVGSHA